MAKLTDLCTTLGGCLELVGACLKFLVHHYVVNIHVSWSGPVEFEFINGYCAPDHLIGQIDVFHGPLLGYWDVLFKPVGSDGPKRQLL